MSTPFSPEIEEMLPRTRDAYYKLILAVGLPEPGRLLRWSTLPSATLGHG